jgi:hypothetical protein
MITLQTARRQYWLTIVYPSICDMLARASSARDREAIHDPPTRVGAEPAESVSDRPRSANT